MGDRLIIGDPWDRKSDLSLSLSLGRSKKLQESSLSKKIQEDSDFDPKLVENSNNKLVIKSKEQEFSCKFCDKKFHSFQALGGHQNAHRRERIISKMNKEIAMGTFGFGAYPCPCSSIENLHSPYYHHMHPMAHISSMPWGHSRPGYGNQGPYNGPFSGHQFGSTSNSSASVQTHINKFATPHNDLEGNLRNHYTSM